MRTDLNQDGGVASKGHQPLSSADAQLLERFRSILDNQSEMVSRFRRDGTLLFVNAAYARSRGTTAEALIGTNLWEFVPDSDRPALEAMLDRLSIDEPEVQIENRFESTAGVLWTRWTNRAVAFDAQGRATEYQSTGIDISSRKLAEDALARSEARFRVAVTAVSDILWTNDAQGRMTGDQPSWCGFTGQTATECQGYGWADVVHPDDQQPTVDAWNQAVTERRTFIFRHRVRRWDGRWRTCDIRAVPILDPAGEVVEWVGVHRDVTESLAAEERFQDLANSMPQLVWTLRADGDVDYYNNRAALYHGFNRREDGTWEWVPAIHPDDLDATLCSLQNALLTGEDYAAEHRVRMKDGTYRWHFSRGVCARDDSGRIIKWYGTGTDIHGMREAQEALRESEQRFRLALSAAEMGTWTWIPAADLVAYDERTGSMFGFQPGEPVTTGRLLREVIHPEDAPTVAAALEAALDPVSSGRYRTQYRIRRPDGSERWVLGHGRTDFASEGADRRPVKMVSTAMDITEQLNIEQALREADQRKDEFLAMLAHELRNPLAPIVNSVHVLRLRGDSDPLVERHRKIIERQAQHLTRMVDDLLDVSRITRGKIELRKEWVDLVEAMDQAVQACSPHIEARRHRLAVSVPSVPVYVEGDRDRLVQVMLNLVQNAAKYTPPGGEVVVACEQDGPVAIFRVRDTGEGISPKLLPRVFDLFTQADRSLDRTQGGLGIGLTMVKNLVKAHSGSVEATSAGLGRGSEFIVRLPALTMESTPSKADPGTAPSTTTDHARRILVVEDNTDAAETLQEILELRGHLVQIASNGPQALEVFGEYRPELMLLDIGLPGMDGLRVAECIRREHPDSGVVLVALTGYAAPEDRARSRAAGFDHHLGKPVEPQRLLDLVESVLKGR